MVMMMGVRKEDRVNKVEMELSLGKQHSLKRAGSCVAAAAFATFLAFKNRIPHCPIRTDQVTLASHKKSKRTDSPTVF